MESEQGREAETAAPVGTAETAETAGAADRAHVPGRRRSRVGRGVVKLSRWYVFGYIVVVFLAVLADVLLRRQLDAQLQPAVTLLATASVALYFLALVLLLASYSARLHVFRRKSVGLKLLYAGVAAVLIARGYFSAGFVLPGIQQGPWPVVMADLGLLGATLVVLGLVAGMLDVVRFAFARAARVRLPRRRKGTVE